MLNVGYSVEYSDKESNGIIWEVVNDHVVEEGVEYEELGIQGFDLVLFNEERYGHTSTDNNY